MNVLDILKIKLRKYKEIHIDPEELFITVEEVKQFVLNYCNRATLPDALNFTIAEMAKDLLIYEFAKSHEEELNFKNTSSIHVGRVNITKGKDIDTDISSHKAKLDDLVLNYREQLNRFRVIGW